MVNTQLCFEAGFFNIINIWLLHEEMEVYNLLQKYHSFYTVQTEACILSSFIHTSQLN